MTRETGTENWRRRLRASAHLAVTLAGAGLVGLALFNLLAPLTDLEAVAPYRPVFATLLIPPITSPLLADLAVLAAGLLLLRWR